MAKQTEICCERSSITCESAAESSDNSEDPDDTLETELSRLGATLNEFDQNDPSECWKSAENLRDNDLNDDPDPYEDINEVTITNGDCHSDSCEDVSEKTIIITNFVVPTPIKIAESDEKQLDENELSECCKSVENLGNTDLNDYPDPCEDINETTITNDDCHSCEDVSEKAIIITNFVVPTPKETAESDNEKQKWLATEARNLDNPPENETNVCNEVLASDQSKTIDVKESHAVSSRVSKKTGKNESTESGSKNTVCVESYGTSDSNTISSDFLSIHPTIDDKFEALIKSPITSSVKISNASLQFSPFRTFQGNWLTSSPKTTNPEELQQSKLTFASPQSAIQNKLASLVSLLENKETEREEQDLKACQVEISELQSSPWKLAFQQLVKNSTEYKLESQSNKSSDSVIILEELNLKKVSSGSFLDLDISQDYDKEWLPGNKDSRGNSFAGPICSTPNKDWFSSLKSRCLGLNRSESFIVLDETGKVCHADSETKVAEPLSAEKDNAKDLNNSIKEVKYEPKSVELYDHQELNISAKQAAVVEYPLETITTDNDKAAEPKVLYVDDEGAEEDGVDDEGAEEDGVNDEGAEEDGHGKAIKVIKSDYLFESDDPAENADNFHPGWDKLRNLKTDEERYKAVRERWRSFVVPNPNIDLTHYSYRLRKNTSKEHPAEGAIETQFKKPPVETRHKRTLSDPSSSSEERSAKRSRTQSCTALFGVKLQQLKEQTDDEQHRLLYEEEQAVQNLYCAQDIQRIPLQSNNGAHQRVSRMQMLHEKFLQDERMRQMQNEETMRVQNEQMIRKYYESARSLTGAEQENKIRLLEQASGEVQKFYKFYKGLEEKENKDISAYLSETQVEELWEAEDFYEQCKKLYV